MMKLSVRVLVVLLIGTAGLTRAGPSIEDLVGALSGPAFKPLVKETGVSHLTTWTGEWRGLGISAKAGDLISLVAEGSWDAAPGLEPKVWLWARVGSAGNAFNLRTNAQSFVSASSGEVEVLMGFGFPEFIVDPTGETREPQPQFADSIVDVTVLGVVWNGRDLDGLLAEKAVTDASWAGPLLATARPTDVPDGFKHLSFVSDSTAFGRWRDDQGRVGVRVQPNAEWGIIRKPLDFPLTADTQVEFDWRFVALPAAGPETKAEHHDYMSLAIEFDNGQDLTWFWSREVVPATIFSCPLPWWNERETHMVLQSGPSGLGEWFTHVRNITDDYNAGVKHDIPNRITAIWFIAGNAFARQPAEAYFANVTIRNRGGEISVFE